MLKVTCKLGPMATTWLAEGVDEAGTGLGPRGFFFGGGRRGARVLYNKN